MRRVTAGILLAFLAAWGVRAEPARPDQRILFTPAPLGGESAVLERTSPPSPRSAAIPKPRPGRVVHPAPQNAERHPTVNLSKTNIDLTAHPLRATSLAAPQPQATDLSPRVGLGGASLGLATSRDDGSSAGGTGLVTLDTKTPIPVDPAVAARQNAIPYFGLSLSAPTN